MLNNEFQQREDVDVSYNLRCVSLANYVIFQAPIGLRHRRIEAEVHTH